MCDVSNATRSSISRRRIMSKLIPTLFSLFIFLHQLDGVLGMCPSGCNGHGTCNILNLCTCFDGYTGFDCADLVCPHGAPWVDLANGIDDIRSVQRECSNMGRCDRSTGLCACEEGFTGQACDRTTCPNKCNGHGTCMSMKQIGTLKDDRNLFFTNVYETPWDADRIYGCVCDLGYEGPDCSLRQCPFGDDPITSGQVDEIQAVSCLCNACTGTFTLSFRGETTRAISPSETAAALKQALEDLTTIRSVTVTLDPSGTAVCSSTGVSALVTFTHEHGDIPALIAISSLTGGTSASALTIQTDGSTSAFGAATQKGTKEWLPCSGRGECDYFKGLCNCEPGFEASDGVGGSGQINDCGYRNPSADPLTNCPGGSLGACNSRGQCSGHPNYKCNCINGFNGYSCAQRVCPLGRAWFEEAQQDNVAHLNMVECSNRGYCDEIGVCRCFPGYEGVACDRLLCPGGSTGSSMCSGQGICRSAREIAALTQTSDFVNAGYSYGTDPNEISTWEADMIQGCWCNKFYDKRGKHLRYKGYDCSKVPCPSGDDPWTGGQVDEVQTITCSATGGTFTLTFRGETTTAISATATEDEVKTALEDMISIKSVSVTYDTGSTACIAAGNAIRITFLSPHGNVPSISISNSKLIYPTGTVSTSVVETIQGTKEDGTCNNRGRCDEATGRCICAKHLASSDGRGNIGANDDCGAVDPFATHGEL